MAEAALDFLLNNLKNLLLYHSDLITDYKNQIESLEMNLSIFRAYLKDPVNKQRKNEQDRDIRDVVYEVEDVIDDFVTQALGGRQQTSSLFGSRKPSEDLHDLGKKVEKIIEKVQQARTDFTNLTIVENKSETPEIRQPRQKDVVGFVDVTDELINRLIRHTDYFDVVCLVGMFGQGKTTVAWKIFNDPAIICEFPVRIWLSISQEFSEKDIFLTILNKFTAITDEIRQKDEKELARLVAVCLERGSFLIVMDDVWTRADWDRLSDALPTDNKKGKVLITSRIEDVGTYACHPRSPYHLRLFNEEESWELLRLEALRKLDCPSELESIGKLIARDCKGLPLAIVTIGGILDTQNSESDLKATKESWEKVSEHVSNYIDADPEYRMNSFISLSYAKLPYYLRPCFLYLGMFPEDYEIPAIKLILMWIGEGFINPSDGYSLEETGEKYLDDLINRNLVKIEKVKHDGKVKTCRIHDTLRDFCLNEAGNEKFYQEIKSVDGVFVPPVSDLHNFRRLSIHSNCLKFISLRPSVSHVRSFVCFSKDNLILPSETITEFLGAFKMLRVLDVKPIKFPKINSDMFLLVHLRYIVLSIDLPTLTSKFSQLWNLQTLIVDTTSRTLEVKADIWKLMQLRHFKINVSTYLPKPSKGSKHGAELQTLSSITVESCSAELFQQACNLKKLGIRGPLALLLEGKKGSLDSLGSLKYLENLKLINDVFPRPFSDGQLNGLPQPYQFPSRLKSLTLRATFLDWSHMSILGLLANLEVLKLKHKAFMGKVWNTVDGGFRHLEFLHIDDTNLEVWTASSHHYPRLRGLVLRYCEKLVGVPVELADISAFQMLELYYCRSAAPSARNIQEAINKAHTEGSAFKLSIFPPID